MNLTNICWLCTLESLVDSKVIKLVNPKGSQPWIFIGKTDAEAEATIFWSPDVKSRLIGKDPDAGRDWRQKEKGVAEDDHQPQASSIKALNFFFLILFSNFT